MLLRSIWKSATPLRMNIDELSLKPIVSDIGSATYKTATYLATILSTLPKSEFTMNNTKEFVDYIKDF